MRRLWAWYEARKLGLRTRISKWSLPRVSMSVCQVELPEKLCERKVNTASTTRTTEECGRAVIKNTNNTLINKVVTSTPTGVETVAAPKENEHWSLLLWWMVALACQGRQRKGLWHRRLWLYINIHNSNCRSLKPNLTCNAFNSVTGRLEQKCLPHVFSHSKKSWNLPRWTI